MRSHKGTHPRMGAMDVCSFIPVANVSMQACADIANTFGQQLAESLGVPVYLYEAAAHAGYRRQLPHIPPLHDAVARLIPMIDADTTAFNDFMEAFRLPRKTDAERAARAMRRQAGLKKAVDIPATTMKIGDGAWDAFCEVARYGNPASRSDIEVGA